MLKAGYAGLRLSHERRAGGRFWSVRPRSRFVESLLEQFGARVAPYMQLDATWKTRVIAALRDHQKRGSNREQAEATRVRRALENLRKQHTWGDLTDEEYGMSAPPWSASSSW